MNNVFNKSCGVNSTNISLDSLDVDNYCSLSSELSYKIAKESSKNRLNKFLIYALCFLPLSTNPLILGNNNHCDTYVTSVKSLNTEKGDNMDRELKENIEILDDFLKLTDNWDGEGACVFNKVFTDFVANILLNLEIQPDVFPLQNGSIVLEFGNVKNKYLEIAISPEKRIDIYKKDGTGNNVKRSNIPYNLNFIKQEVNWFES